MEAVDAVRVFQGSEHKAAVSQGPVIALLCVGTSIHQACTLVSVPTLIHVTLRLNTIITLMLYDLLCILIMGCEMTIYKEYMSIDR